MVFLGDPGATEERTKLAIRSVMPSHALDLDVEHVRLPEDDVGRIPQALAQVGMFSRARCVVVRGALERAEDCERLLACLEKGVPPESALIIAAPKLDGRSRLYRWLQQNARIEDFRVETKWDGSASDTTDLAAFVRARIKANGFPEANGAVVEAILARGGTDFMLLGAEVDRLCLSVDPPRQLTRDDVAEWVRDLAAAWVFDFIDALLERRSAAAHTIVARLLAEGEPALKMVATLATRTADLLAAATAAEHARLPPPPPNATAFARGVYPGLSDAVRKRFSNPYRAYHAFRVGQARGARSLRDLHRRLLALDVALKTGVGLPRHLLANFIDLSTAERA